MTDVTERGHEATEEPRPAPRKALGSALRVVAVACGAGVAAHFVRDAGTSRVLDVLRAAGPWLPSIVAIEAAIVLLDAASVRVLTGDAGRRSPLAVWVRGAAYANACAVFLPAGRAAGEAARSAILSPSVGTSSAVGACARFQVCALFALAAASALGAAFIAVAPPAPADSGAALLATLLLANALLATMLGGGVGWLARRPSLRARAERLLARLSPSTRAREGAATPPSRRASAIAWGLCLGGRFLQAAQYGVAVAAVGGRATAASAVVAHGVHVVGASAGDLVPGQLGVMEALYASFARSIGLGDAPAAALSIALVMRAAQIALALAMLLAAAALPGRRP